jgi:HAD superfamily hydrolase (TIGR01484 family)
MVVTDLDGTLSHPSGQFTPANLQALGDLGRAGIVRVVATGRSLHFARRQLAPDFPIDYLIFSSGAGILDWSNQTLLVKHGLSADDCQAISRLLIPRQLGFMLHDPVPDNHHFAFWEPGKPLPDFAVRCQRHAAFARPWDPHSRAGASQFLVVVGAADAETWHQELRVSLATYSVIRATSPISAESAWIEIFPHQVSKSQGASWIAARHGIATGDVLAVGNDYNDRDLLGWAGTARVVADAPEPLRRQFPVVAAHDQSGFAEAVAGWIASRGE